MDNACKDARVAAGRLTTSSEAGPVFELALPRARSRTARCGQGGTRGGAAAPAIRYTWHMSRHARAWSGALLGIAVLAFGWLCAAKGNDFLAFYDVGETTRLHGDLYARGRLSGMPVPYPPMFGLVMAPFSLLPPFAAALVWYALKVVGFVFLFRWLLAGVRAENPGAGPRLVAGYVALPFLVALNPFMSEFRLGQANLWVLVFSILTVRSLERGRPLWAAAFFSLAAIKVTALALLPWFLFRRQWRFLAALLPVGAAWLVALAAWWGPGQVAGLFLEWVRSTASRKATTAAVAHFENQSLQGAAARLSQLVPALQERFLGLAVQQWLWIVPCLAVLAVLLASAARDRFRPRLPVEELALGSLLMLLASSDSRWAHHVQLFVPLAVVAVLAARVHLLESVPRLGPWLAGTAPGAAGPAPRDDPGAARLRRTVAALLGAGLVILVLLGRDVIGPAANRAVRAMSLHTVFDLVLAAFLVIRLLRRPAEDGARAPVTSLSADQAALPSA